MCKLRISRKAERGLRAIRLGDPRAHRRLTGAIDDLAHDPRPVGSKRLTSVDPPTWRVRVGEYRITYEVHDDIVEVVVVGVGHRSHVYR
jgi:mRNA interferase RelE/StbE